MFFFLAFFLRFLGRRESNAAALVAFPNINLYNHLDLLFIAHFSSLLLKMSELNLPCSPGGTLLEDLHMDSLSSDSDDEQDDVKKRKLPITDKGQLIPKPNSKSSI